MKQINVCPICKGLGRELNNKVCCPNIDCGMLGIWIPIDTWNQLLPGNPMVPVYLHDFKNVDAVKESFAISDEYFRGITILLATYSTSSYEGSAFVLFERDGKLYEVNASHCSCYGLEGQWDPDDTTVEDLRYRIEAGSLGSSDYFMPFANELKVVLAEYEKMEETH